MPYHRTDALPGSPTDPMAGLSAGDPGRPALTPREREVLPYVASGRANKVIAIDLGISMRTVETHRARIFRKTGVRNAAELARWLYGRGGTGLSLAEPEPALFPGRAQDPRRQG